MASARPLTALLGTLVFTVFVPGVVALAIPLSMVRGDPLAPWWPLGAMLVAAGIALYLWCAGLFSLVGRGTPAPIAAPSVFVARGPYRRVRNPMYVAVLLTVVGIAIAYASLYVLVYAILVAIAFHFFVIGYEEPTLTQKFGDAYREYRRQVPRWLPRFGRGSPEDG